MIFNYEPLLTQADKCAAKNAISSGLANPKVIHELESYLSEFFGVPAITCNSGTSALHLSLLAADLKDEDEVICPVITFAASWNVIKYIGAKPVFVDVDPRTWCIDTKKLEQHITKKTKAIICVDLYGNPCDYNELLSICKRHDLTLISDAAAGLGSNFNNKPLGSIADFNCFSLNLNKIITSNGGGIVCLGKKFQNKESKIKQLLNQSSIFSSKHGYDYNDIGFNYRFNSINAAIAFSQINRLKSILAKKRLINSYYKKRLSGHLRFQEPTEHSVTNNWMNVILFNTQNQRDKANEYLRSNNIESKIMYKPANEIKWLQDNKSKKFINARNLYKKSLSLPSGLSLSKKTIDFICDKVLFSLENG
tara:strand:- start:2257 stop:3351 length:1095 start_codon:yes stop_codon:yes gene_type:complete